MGCDPTLNLVVLRCNDLARSRLFYDALGLRFVDERHGQRPPHVSATLPGGTVVVPQSSSLLESPSYLQGTLGAAAGARC